MKNGSKLASSAGGFEPSLLRERPWSRRRRCARRCRPSAARSAACRVRRRPSSPPRRARRRSSATKTETGRRRLRHHRLHDRLRLFQLHSPSRIVETARQPCANPTGRRDGRRNRDRHARLRLHGQGALARVPGDRTAGHAAAAPARRGGGAERGSGRGHGGAVRLRALDDRLARPRLRSGDHPLRQRRPQLAPCRADDRRRRGGQARPLREAARPRRRRELRDLAARRGDGRQAPLRLQLPLRPRGAAGAGADRGRRARRDPALPRPLPAGLGRRPDASTPGASSRTRRDRARSATSARTSSTWRASSSARSRPSPASSTPSCPAGASTTRSRPPSSSRAARSGRSRRRGSRSAGATRSSGRSTARRRRSRSTWSG